MTVIGILFEKRFVDDSGFPRTPDRPVKLLGTCVRYLRSVETSIGARGPDFLGGSATNYTSTWLTNVKLIIHLAYNHALVYTLHHVISSLMHS